MFGFGRKKEKTQKIPPYKEICDKLSGTPVWWEREQNMVWWRHGEGLSAALSEWENGTLVIDTGVLDVWLYPDALKGKEITEKERAIFEQEAAQIFAAQGIAVKIESTRLESGFSRRKGDYV